uniref:Uncharacterized protein n=1 Tax=Cacopsylla melanoneura TaxID=428564 RepID=A0A8D8ZCG1_9HEMI
MKIIKETKKHEGDRITNEEVLRRIGGERIIMKIIKKRRDQLIGHNLRHEGILNHILESGIGLTTVGRAPLKYISQIIIGCESYHHETKTINKIKTASKQCNVNC